MSKVFSKSMFATIFALSLTACQSQSQPPQPTMPTPVTLFNTEQISVNDINGNRHNLLFSAPLANIKNPNEIIIVLDGDSLFGAGLRELRLSQAGFSKENKGKILIGLGYPDTELFNKRRTDDYTGNNQVIDTLIKNELLPRTAPIEKTDIKRTLFGHSLGGLYGLAALKNCLNETCPYQHLVIASPSLWWNDEQALKEWQTLAITANFKGKPLPQITLSVGELEQASTTNASRNEQLDKRKMVANAKLLSELFNKMGINHTFTITPNATHHDNSVASLKQVIDE